MHIRSVAVTLVCAVLPALAAWGTEPAWSLRVAAQDPVPFRGLAKGDDGGKPGAMLYPAPGLAGLLVGIATHGVIVGSQRDSARTESEKQADKVIDPYRDSLAHFTQRELAAAALAAPALSGAKLWSAQDGAGAQVVESAPLFFMTSDSDALVLDNSVAVMREGAPAYRNTIRVVSAPHVASDLTAHWGDAGATTLKTESASLMALSLEIALAQAGAPVASPEAGPFRTVRYLQGRQELFERAQVLDERCGRALIRNLRGWLMSVPLAKASAGAAACNQGAVR